MSWRSVVKKWRLIVVIMVVGTVLVILNRKNQPLDVSMIKPTQQSFAISIMASGELMAHNTADLKPVGTGKVASLLVKSGDVVQKGQVLGAINTVEAGSNLQNAIMARDKAIAAADEIRETYGENITWGAGYYRLKQAQKAIEQSQTQITIFSQQLGDRSLVAPFDGVVLDTAKVPGEIASTGDASPLVKLADLNSLYFKVQIDEEDIGKVREGQVVLIDLDGFPEGEYQGSVQIIKKYTVKDETGASVIEAEIDFGDKNRPPTIIGLSGDAEIILDKVPEGLTLPIESIRYDEGTPFVYTLEKNRVVKTKIELGRESEDLVQVTQGLSDQAQVIMDDSKEIKDGKRVVVK